MVLRRAKGGQPLWHVRAAMPIPTTAKLPKPKSEDEFEDICVDFLRIRWKDPHASRNGRRGQRQDGVDIVGHPPWLKGKTACAQCKNTDTLKAADVVAEAKKARSFRGDIGEFLVLTSGDRDAGLQTKVRQHFKRKPAPFDVEVVFWADIVSDIALDDALVTKHWKGFGASRPPDGFDPPRWFDRTDVNADETVECQCELALRTPGCVELGASELAAATQAVAGRGSSSAEIHHLVQKPARRTSGRFVWSEPYRERDVANVVRKWELEIGDGGLLTFRWSKFTNESNHRRPMLETLPLLDGVIAPVRLHRLAVEHVSKATGITLPGRVAARLSCCANGTLLLSDNIRATLPERFGMPESPSEWAANVETNWSGSSRALCVRLLNGALSNFVGSAGQFVTINEEVVTRVGGVDL